MSAPDPPFSGYAITGVYSLNQELKQVPDDVELPNEEKIDITFTWDWRFGQNDNVEVMLSVSTDASKKRRYKASVMVAGVFRQVGDNPSVTLQDFVATQAVAILLPYARQHLATLTMATVSGAFHLPTINVIQLVKGFQPAIASGMKQLAEREQSRSSKSSTADSCEATRTPS